VQRHALQSIDAGKDDAVPEADECLLELLAEAVQNGQTPTAGELLAMAQERDPNTFGKTEGRGPRWQPNAVTRRLKNYGIPAPRKSNGQRRYREVNLATLQRIQRHYGIDLGIADLTASHSQGATLTDPLDTETTAANRNGRVSQGR
jgi:hypothetical protein